MSTKPAKASRGRPKTLKRSHVLDFAMHAYWKEGVDVISVNEICRRCEISKPGLYRESGGEDGLMKAVHLTYMEQVFTPRLEMLKTKTPFREVLNDLVSFATTLDDNQEEPKGCLMVKMFESRARVGSETREEIDRTRKLVLAAYEDWVERSKAKG